MKFISLLILLIAFFSGQLSAQPDTLAYFDFWVGKWEATWDEGDGKMGKGINEITKVLDETVIKENFQILEGASKGFKGTSISVYQSRNRKWKQAWADNQGGYFDFTGRLEGKNRIFQTEVIDLPDDKKFTQRMVFRDIKKDRMTWDWESSIDGGETWKLNWQINYTKVKE